MARIVGIGEYVVSNREEDILQTFALATCVGVTAYSPEKKAAGMIHVALPAPFNTKDRLERPGYFAETGIPLLIHSMCRRYGCRVNELHIRMYGGVEQMLKLDVFNIGQRNIDAVKRSLADLGLAVREADLRGSESRTLLMEVATGMVKVRRQPIVINFGKT